MPPTSSLTLRYDGREDELKPEWTDLEWRRLLEFTKEAEGLTATEFIKSGAGTQLKISFQQGQGLKVASTRPSMEALRQLLHAIRPFILQREPFSFVNMTSLIGKKLSHPVIRALLKSHSEEFSGLRSQRLFTLKLNHLMLNSDEALMKWLNAYEYHRDEDKQLELEQLTRAFPSEALITMFASMLTNKVRAIMELADLIRCILGKQKEHSAMVQVRQDSGPQVP